MTKRSRTLLFGCLGAFFVIAAPAVILYAQGYRFDWTGKQIVQVGAFYFDVIPSQVSLSINGEAVGTTGRFVGTSFTKSMPPGSYRIVISKDGYHSWQKTLSIEPRQVTEAPSVVLFPADPAFAIALDNAQQVWFAPNSQEAIVQKSRSGSWQLSLWNAQRGTEYPLFEPEQFQASVQAVTWAPDSNAFIFQIKNQNATTSFVQQLDRDSLSQQRTNQQSLAAALERRTSLAFLGASARDTRFSPFDAETILFLVGSGSSAQLGRAHYEQQQILSAFAHNTVAFQTISQGVLWLDAEGHLWRLSSLQGTPEKLTQVPLTIQRDLPYNITGVNEKLFVSAGETLFAQHETTSAFEQLFPLVSSVEISPDSSTLAVVSGREIWLYYLAGTNQQPYHARGEKVFLTRFSGTISNLQWINSHYLVFSVENDIKIAEIDNRDGLNIVDIAHYANPNIFWNPQAKTLYIHNRQQLRVSEKLLP